jgi:phosphotriesterase-related protein
VQLDLFGYPAWTNENFLHFPTDSQRVLALVQLASEGHADQLLMSHDVCQKMQLSSRGGFGYAHIPSHVAALFAALGAPPDLFQRLGVSTPRRLLSWDRLAAADPRQADVEDVNAKPSRLSSRAMD